MAQLKSGTRIYGDATVDGRLGLGTNNNIRIGDVSTGSSITTGTNNFFAGASAGLGNTSGSFNNFLGNCSGRANTSGKYNNFFGWQAGVLNTTGSYNNFFGTLAGRSNTTGNHNTFFGLYSACSNTIGCHNNFFGVSSGRLNIAGKYNNYFGFLSGFNNNGSSNNFIGVGAGRSTTNANNNNFFGFYAGKGFGASVTGSDNNFFGNCSGFNNTSGSCNNFLGCQSGFNNSTGNHNNFVGWRAGLFNTTGSNNNFFGQSAGCTQTLGDRNVAIGYSVQLPITTGSDQLVIGSGNTSWITGNSSFNVGIGTTNPQYKTHIVGIDDILAIESTSTTARTTLKFLTNGNDWEIGARGSSNPSLPNTFYIWDNAASAYRQVIDASGNFLINTSTTTGTASQALQVNSGGYFNGSVGIGTTNPSTNLHVQGNARVTGAIYDSSNLSGSTGQVLQSTQTGTQWATAAAGGGSADGTDFNSGITTTTYVSVGSSLTGFTGIGISFPSTSSRRYLIESIHVTNVSPSDLYLTSRIDYIAGSNVTLTNKIIVPYQGTLEILEESIIANPSDIMRFAAFTGIGVTAGGVSGGLDCFITYTTKTGTSYIGSGSNSTTTSDATVFTSTTYPSVVNTIVLTNSSDYVDVDASVSIFRGGTVRQGYLVYNITVPQNSSVQILPKAKKLNVNDTISVRASVANILSTHVSGIYVV